MLNHSVPEYLQNLPLLLLYQEQFTLNMNMNELNSTRIQQGR